MAFGFNSSFGYERLFQEAEERIKAAQHKTDQVQSNIIHNTAPNTGNDIFSTEAEKKQEAVYPTDVMPGVHVQNPTLNNVDVLDVNKTVDSAPPDPSAQREAQNDATDLYQDMDLAIKGEFLAELKEVDREAADAFEKTLAAPGGTSTFCEAMKLADPGVGDLYTVLSALMGQPNNERVMAAIDKTLGNLQARTDHQNELAARGRGPAPKIDWNKFETPKQLMEFLKRDVSKDPFMQQAQDNEKVLERMEKNFDDYNDKYLQGKQIVTEDMKVAAVGNEGLLKTLAKGDEVEVERVKIGKPRFPETLDEVQMILKPGSDITAMPAKKSDIADLDVGAKDILKNLEKPRLHMEPQRNLVAANEPFIAASA